MKGGKVLIDGDVIAYRAAYSCQKDFSDSAARKVDELMGGILEKTCDFIHPSSYEVFLTGKNNFRHDIAKTVPYKGNRSDREKPIHLGFCRDYLVINYGATLAEGEEADDRISIRATELGEDTIIVSVDKDFHQVPCWQYNFLKDEWKKVDEFEGLKFFYSQILSGDVADNIIGLYRIGPVKAKKMLEGCTTEKDMWDVCVKAYEGEERPLENARLAWLRRYDGQMWEPPE